MIHTLQRLMGELIFFNYPGSTFYITVYENVKFTHISRVSFESVSIIWTE